MLGVAGLDLLGLQVTEREHCETLWISPAIGCRDERYGPVYDGCHWRCAADLGPVILHRPDLHQ
jgi:hypothetical protein